MELLCRPVFRPPGSPVHAGQGSAEALMAADSEPGATTSRMAADDLRVAMDLPTPMQNPKVPVR
jgi:hypothetical protein